MKAVSELVSYVLLILLSLSLAAIVYGFLQYKARIPEKVECQQGISIYIYNLTYDYDLNKVNFSLKNNGLWNISGINVKIYSGFHICNFTEIDFDSPLPPGEIKHDFSIIINCQPKKLEVLPFIKIKNKRIYCSNALLRIQLT